MVFTGLLLSSGLLHFVFTPTSAAAPAGWVLRPVRQGIIGWRRDMRSGLRVRFGGGSVGVCYGLVLFSVRKASGCNPYFVSKLRLLVYSC